MPFESSGHGTDELAGVPAHNVQSFLTQAMAQNLQIQKQLMEQNNALQKLLSDQSKSGSSSNVSSPRKHSQHSDSSLSMEHFRSIEHRSSDHRSMEFSRSEHRSMDMSRSDHRSMDMSRSDHRSMDLSRSDHSRSDHSRSDNSRSAHRASAGSSSSSSSSSSAPNIPAPPPPPPLPTELIEGSRPLLDPFGRAKTVRIGKWRWPPRDSNDVFMINNSNKKDQEDPPPPKPIQYSPPEVPGVVGKLRISNEMRAKLENVTGGNGKNGSKKEAVRKIEDDRKAMLMEKLGGRALTVGQTDTFTFVPPPPPPPVHDQHSQHNQHNQHNQQQLIMSETKTAMKINHHDQSITKHTVAMSMQMPMQMSHHHSSNQSPKGNFRRENMMMSSSAGESTTRDFCLSYGRVNWTLRLRKELIMPWENIEQDKKLLNLLYIQILNDMNSNTSRLTNSEKTKLRQLTSTTNSKLNIVQYTIKNTEFYFVVIFPAIILRGGGEFSGKYDNVTHVAVDVKTLKFIRKVEDGLIAIETRSLGSVKIRDSKICESNVAIHEPYLSYLLNLTTFLNQSAVSIPPPPPVTEMKTLTVDAEPAEEIVERDRKPQDDGKHSLLQFAMSYFRHMDRYPTDNNEWTWKALVSYVKYGPGMLQESLLQLDEANNQLALECYEAVLCYMGDLQGDVTQVECVYTLLRNCHKSAKIIDELYCHLMKQTTNNNKTGLAGWRLFTIITAYFSCSELLRPYLFKYLEATAYDKRRNFHGTALVALQNLRKTFKYGGRRNVPSVEEITALTAGRNAKRQIFRLPGGNDRVVNVRAATIVEDVLNELCSTLNIRSAHERQEFSLYCIVEGDTFTMPLQLEEYILDVTTELTKNNQVFYLIFCRSVWFYELKLDNPLYVEVIFNQVAPDYLEGLLVVMQEERLTQAIVYDITRIAALLHRAADLSQPPTLKETKYLLPKPALAARDLKPNQWVQMVNSHWVDERIQELTPHDAKCGVLEILQTWPLFGSSFFTLKRINEPQPPVDYILALNKSGVHFLDMITHETINTYTYNQVISTRKVKNEEGILFLDLKVGNLMQQRILRLETEHAHEISRLIRQYIHIQRLENNGQ